MGFALQWHTAHSGSEPIVAATDRPQPMNLAVGGDVLVVMCTIRRGDCEDARAAAALARDIVGAYSDACSGAATPQSDEVIAERMADAIILSANRIALPAHMDDPCDPVDQIECNILAATVRGRTLLVARSGNGQVYLLRNAELQHLTGTVMDATDPLELGKLELKGEDRVLVCTGALTDALKPIELRRILKAQPSSRRTAQALLDAAEQINELQGSPQHQIGLAVIDFVSGKFGAFAPKPESQDAPLARMRVAALPLAVVASVALVAAIAAASTIAAPAQQSASASANVDALPALVHIATNAPRPIAQAGMPGAGSVIIEPDGALPRPGARAIATVTTQPVLSRKTASGSTFLRNIRAKPSVSPTPIPTPLALALVDGVEVGAGVATVTPAPQPAPTAQPAPAQRQPRPVLEIEPRTAAITLGEALALSAEVRDENGMVVTSDVVAWQPSELVTATDARSAIFNAYTSGTFTVTAALGDLSAQATIVVMIPINVAGGAGSTTADSPAQAPLSTTAALTATVQSTTEPTPTPDPTLASTPAPTLDLTVLPAPTFEPTPVLTQTTTEPIPTPEG